MDPSQLDMGIKSRWAAVAAPDQRWVGKGCQVPSHRCPPAHANPSTLAGSVGGRHSLNWTPSRQRTAFWQGGLMPSSCTPMSRRVLPSSSARSSLFTPGECPAQSGRTGGPGLSLRLRQAGSSPPPRVTPNIITGTSGSIPAPGEGWDLLSPGPQGPSLLLALRSVGSCRAGAVARFGRVQRQWAPRSP